ncbi:hypothetical protein HOU04_gp091 [Synechococcus phage S-T4]|jgi:hypothetical protein|uniref:Uncharacterized protein n=1 Tax=Synechococcus phage S-T4 TaxID=2268578 RepID=A0A385EFP1_9CAUD|nr:hypothetical protein HOU04_gp091 [Synechococcus phage S-T4]AXQ70490.1 hypothetical protein [Synechococcus phage S-T4]
MEIPEIKIRELDIPQWSFNDPSHSLPYVPPVTVNIGVPIVDIPGCVEAHEANNGSKTLPTDDERGLLTYCDSGIPSFNPIQFEPDQMIFTEPAKTPKVRPPEAPELPNTPEIKPPVSTAKVDCPTPAQEAKEPVGTLVEGFRKKVVEYKLMGNECVQITEAVPLPKQIIAGLPSGGQVVQVGGVAVIATASALMAKPLADLLLKTVKPTVKKVMKKIAAIRGKSVLVLSVKERRDLQRERTQAIRALKSVLKPKG